MHEKLQFPSCECGAVFGRERGVVDNFNSTQMTQIKQMTTDFLLLYGIGVSIFHGNGTSIRNLRSFIFEIQSYLAVSTQ